MNTKRMNHLMILLIIALLAACAPAADPGENDVEATKPEATSEIDEAAGAVDPEETADPTDTEPVDRIVVPAPESTTDRGIRITPGAPPRDVEIVPQSTPEPVIEPVPEELMAQVMADLQARSGLAPLSDSDYTIIRAEAVTWPDGSLGCPEPGMMYTQALVDGFHLVIEVDGETFDYRLASDGFVKLCEQALRP